MSSHELSPSLPPSLSSVESLRYSLPQEHQSLFDTLRKTVIDFCTLHHIPTSSLNNDEALREATKHLPLPDLAHLSLVLKRLEYLVTHKEPMPGEWVSLTQEQAREIMGRNFLGTIEAEKHFGELSPEQEEALSTIPFSKETLEECSQTHILVADIGSSILDVQEVKICKDKNLLNNQRKEDGYADDFITRTEPARWRLVRKSPVKGSLFKVWDEQLKFVNSEIDIVPSARQVIYTTILFFLVTGERLFMTCYVRTSDDEPRDYYRVYVGSFKNNGLRIKSWLSNSSFDDIGLSSARKPIILES